MTIGPDTLLYALLGGILPVLLWLWFWLKEDARRPEPRGLIILSFIAGMVIIVIAIPLEKLAYSTIANTGTLLVVWAVIEEVLKFGAVLFIAMRSRFFDEPTDPLVYMITVALGFAAIENTFFLLGPLANGEIWTGVMTGNLRYVGAALLHVAASSAVGIALGLAYYRSRVVKLFASFVGLFIAIVLHALFNFFIMRDNGNDMLIVFLHLWVAIVIVILFFERLKRMVRVTYLRTPPTRRTK